MMWHSLSSDGDGQIDKVIALSFERPPGGYRILREVFCEESEVQVEITCRHGSISSEFQEYVSRKAEKLLNYFERVTAIQVTFDYEKDRVKVEMLVDAEHKHDFVTHYEGPADEVAASFEQTLAKMEQQIRKYKSKVTDHRRDKPMNEVAGDPLAEE